MDASLVFAQFLSGLSRGMMLFLIASGLSLIFGVMNILNFAHATLWLVGAYVCYTFWFLMQDYAFGLWLSIPLAALVLAALLLVLLTLESAAQPADMVTYYREQAASAGIDVATSLDSGPMTMIGGENADGTSFSFTATREGEVTRAQLSIGRGLE